MKDSHPKEEKTCVLIKPDGVKRGLVGEITARIERRDLKVIALGMIWATKEQADRHYPKDEKWVRRLGEKTLTTYRKYGLEPKKELGTADTLKIGQMVRGWLVDYITKGPMVKMIIQGVHAIDMVRKLAGDSQPALAEMGTIRGDYSVDSAASANRDKRAIHNILHASETAKEAEHEIKFWFKKGEIHHYKRGEEEMML